VLRSLLALSLLCACGSHPDVAKVPHPATANSNKLPDGPPLVTPGERMSYRVALQGLELASYDIGIGDVTDLAGKQTVVVQAHAKTVGIGAFVKVDDFFSSWIDVMTGRSLRWVADEFATNGKDKERTEADLAARNGDLVPITFHANDDPPAPEPQTVSKPDVWDYNAFLVALRSWEGPPGSAVTVEVLRSRYLWHVEMKIAGKENMVTELGELPALRFDGHTYKLDRKGMRFPDSDERDFSVWISDDDGRVPLKVVAKTDYGDINMEIVDYLPGTGKRLRN
jgi:hypothetical protein